MIMALLVLLVSVIADHDYFEEIRAQSDHYNEGEFTVTEFSVDEKIVFAATILTKRDGHFLIHVKPSENFGPLDQLICFNPTHKYQFELARNEQHDGWKLDSVETEMSNAVDIYIGPNGVYRNYCVPTFAGVSTFQSLVEMDGAKTSYHLDEMTNTLTAIIDLSEVKKQSLSINAVTMVFQRKQESATADGIGLRILSKTLAFRDNVSIEHRYEYSGESPIPSVTNYYRNGEKGGYHRVDFSDMSRSDDVFSLSHYGFPEPPMAKQSASWSTGWFSLPALIVIFGVLICSIGIALKWRQK
jgi:hypothetical protein